MPKFTLQSYIRIGKIIPKQKLTLFTGLPSVGKSYTLLKFLNINSILPIWFNLDEDPALTDFAFKGMTSDIKFSTRKFSYQDRLWVGGHYCFNSRILASKAKQFKLSVKATTFSIPLNHLIIHRHKSLLVINDDT